MFRNQGPIQPERRGSRPSSSSMWCVATAVLAGFGLSCLTACESPAPRATPGAVAANERYFPTGELTTSAILLRQSTPGEVRVGQEYDGSIEVKNLTDVELQNIVVNLDNLSNVQFISSSPEWTRKNGEVRWDLPVLPASGTEVIRFRAKAMAAGSASNCLSVTYANRLCATTSVVEPQLQLAKSATPEVCGTCADITLTYAVRNSGTGVARGVVVKDTLPEGLVLRDGRTAVELQAGDLAAGVERIYNLSAQAKRRGTFTSAAYATSESGPTAQSEAPATVVRQPAFAFSCDANNRVFLGRDLDYRITVRNIGDCDASEVLVKAPVPSGSTFLAADSLGRMEEGTVAWRMDRLGKGEAATLTMSIRPSAIGIARTTATASAACVAAASTECSTEIAGIPAILLEVVDTLDPVEVGSDTTFIVTATNQGSSADTNVQVVATLPPSMQFVSGSGATPVVAVGQSVTMSRVASLAPGAKAEWRVVVRAKSAQDARSRWEMTSDQFKTPVIETESSNLYE